MGCANSSRIEVKEDKREEKAHKNGGGDKKNDDSSNSKIEDENDRKKVEDAQKENDSGKDEENSEKEKYKKKDDENNKKLEIKTTGNKKAQLILSTDENKNISNINTEGVFDTKKINLKKQNYEGVTLMKGVEEYIPEELNEEEVHNLVENALYEYNIKDKNDIGEVSKQQSKAISSILYNKIHKKEINMKDYPELKGLTVKIGVEKLTKDVIRKMMFNNKKVDDCQIDLTYANLTKDNDDIRALTIELLK